MIASYLTDLVTVTRRVSSGTDALGNPTYGSPVSWATVYSNMPSKLAFSSNPIRFDKAVGERPLPSGVMYFNPGFTLKLEDRILSSAGVQYVVISLQPAILIPNVIDHYEAVLALP